MSQDAADEEELKLELTADDADLLEASALFCGNPAVVRQESAYFDTPDHELARAGLSLRIRRNGKRRVQTVKSERSSAGMLVRAEWEREATGDHPVIEADNPVAALLKERTALLTRVFVVENQRKVWNRDGIEIALDRGRIVAGDRSASLCEIELERKDGALGALFDLARKIDAITPARINVLSKAERGYRLLGPATRAVKAAAIAVTADMTAAESFRVVAGACLTQFHRNVPLILDQGGDHGNAAALHQARVAIRRLRSALSIYKAILADDRAVARYNRELRWLAGKLGAVREIDVLIGRVHDGAVLERLIAARANAYAPAASALRSKRCRAVMLELAEWIAIGDWQSRPQTADLREEPVARFAARALGHRRKILKKRAAGLRELGDDARHEARKAAKKMRYAADFFAALYTDKGVRNRLNRFVETLETLQDRLGELNDLATAPQVIERIGMAGMPEVAAVVGKGDKGGKRDKARLLKSAAELRDDFVAAQRYWT